jgi:hypothetical protein
MASKSVATNIFENVKPTNTAPVNATETLEQKIARLEAENEALKANKTGFKAGSITVKITDGGVWKDPKTGIEKTRTKGRISMYGLQRMPITLSADQWTRLHGVIDGSIKVRLAGSNGAEFTFDDFLVQAEKNGLLAHKE